MKKNLLFLATGIGIGIVMMQTIAAQNNSTLKLNHVGIGVKNFDESLNYYTKTLGFRLAFTFDMAGGRRGAYVQPSKDTFIELGELAAGAQPGLTHVGIETGDMNATIARLQQVGVKADGPRTNPNNATMANVTDPNGIRLELLQAIPDSPQRKAMDSFK